MDFTVRSTLDELMDDPNMEFEVLKKAYKDINLCNKILGGEGITLNGVVHLVKNYPQKSYTILDMGCGDGSMLVKLSEHLFKNGVSHRMIGVDQRADVLRIAEQKTQHLSHINFHKQDILQAGKEFECDILINTLTMHHFGEERIEAFLSKFANLARLGIVINDLHRSKWAYHLFKIFSVFFIKTDVAKYDGLVSISKGFKRQELLTLAKNIPNVTHTIHWKWAFRYVWLMEFNRQNI